MGLLSSMFAPPAAVLPGPADDYWYAPYSPASGEIRVDAATALTVSTVYRGVSVLANTLAMLPFPVLEVLPDDRGEQKADRHRLYRTLHDKPNPRQTSFQWRRLGMVHCILHGNAYSRIRSPRGFGTELWPLNPLRTQPVDELQNGQLLYEHITEQGEREILRGGEEILHIPAIGVDGVKGLSIIALMRRAVEKSVNTERFGAALFSRAPMMRGFFSWPKKMEAQAKQTFEDSFRRRNSGSEGWYSTPILEAGMTWQDAKFMSAEDAQFVESQEASIPDFARFIGVPTVLLMHADKTALYANAEQFFQSFLNFDIAHWLVNWEQTINQTLFLESEQDRYKCEFNRQAILRADAKTRAEYFRVMAGELGLFTRNEVRRVEGWNAVDGFDDPPAPHVTESGSNESGVDEENVARFRAIAAASTRSLARREVAELRKRIAKASDSPDALDRVVTRFYRDYQSAVEMSLAMAPEDAAAYCARRRTAVLESSGAVLETWEANCGAALANLIGANDGAST